MELEGTIVLDLGKVEGVSKAGKPWKKREYVLETPGMYPRKVKFHVFGDRADMLNFNIGQAYVLSVDVESREFNGRWYTDVSAFAARPADGTQTATANPAQQGSVYGQPANTGFPTGNQNAISDPFTNGGSNDTDDLPF